MSRSSIHGVIFDMTPVRPLQDAIAPLLVMRAIALKEKLPLAVRLIERTIHEIKADIF
jgi:hypothetical protein